MTPTTPPTQLPAPLNPTLTPLAAPPLLLADAALALAVPLLLAEALELPLAPSSLVELALPAFDRAAAETPVPLVQEPDLADEEKVMSAHFFYGCVSMMDDRKEERDERCKDHHLGHHSTRLAG